jgi:iron complex transport system ATP-binding protein
VSNASITTNNLTIGYENHVVQRDVSFSLFAGEMVCMLGPNGCGKSTLLRTLAGLQPALNGSFKVVEFQRFNVQSAIALVLTERLSLDNTTVHDVVAMGRYPYTSFLGGLSANDEQVIAQSLSAVGLEGTEHTYFNAHSDGEKQRALIAKAIAQETPIILLDEPTAHLDLPNRIRILQLLRRLAHEQGKTILISTHELDLAIQLSDRILLLSENGVQLDTAAQLRQTKAFTHAFGMDIFHPLEQTY